ncbi:Protein kinase, catalytic domain-containing protein [Artemisia annua]|uniref:non-specific serine/threonine protein kinase n=1 Tax=Artemisia annua TaxID=35608 RepID=A0A2U1QF95_ARTAN|nr:Protein kinase, catalytic domain-containing protein [Artemisia annua]
MVESESASSSTMSSDSCTSFSRLSFDVLDLLPSTTENMNVKPHRSSESSWQAIKSMAIRRTSSEGYGAASHHHGVITTSLTFRDFSLVRQIGSGDIGKVYLCKLRNDGSEGGECFYAMKVVDKEVLVLKKKVMRAATEKKILNMLDHPFLPSLYAQFDASHFSCVVMEYCSGGDLHSLRHKQPRKRFSLSAARFYAAEVLVALEYLHMLGIIYRDLKPENVLVRSDGHIMLTDFDLSLCSDAIPAVQSQSLSSSPDQLPSSSSYQSSPSIHRPPSHPFSCLPSQLFRSKKITSFSATKKRLFVAEPVAARSCSFVGTHEYVSPEVASGRSHGNAVDWWALGIFIYEMVYGCTPFAGVSNEATLRNIVKKPLAFPTVSVSTRESQLRDLISKLLNKDPESRFGSKRGAADIKTHPFFNGLNFALIRSVTPPVIPNKKMGTTATSKYFGGPTSSFDFF